MSRQNFLNLFTNDSKCLKMSKTNSIASIQILNFSNRTENDCDFRKNVS
jgi:hypothetical protein